MRVGMRIGIRVGMRGGRFRFTPGEKLFAFPPAVKYHFVGPNVIKFIGKNRSAFANQGLHDFVRKFLSGKKNKNSPHRV